MPKNNMNDQNDITKNMLEADKYLLEEILQHPEYLQNLSIAAIDKDLEKLENGIIETHIQLDSTNNDYILCKELLNLLENNNCLEFKNKFEQLYNHLKFNQELTVHHKGLNYFYDFLKFLLDKEDYSQIKIELSNAIKIMAEKANDKEEIKPKR